jgi:hypothetical protein
LKSLRPSLSHLLTSALLLLPSVAVAQDDTDTLPEKEEDAPGETPDDAAPVMEQIAPPPPVVVTDSGVELEFETRASAAVHASNNLDFRAYDNESDESVRDTDDKTVFGYSDLGGSLTATISPRIRLRADAELETQWPAWVLTGSSSAELNLYGLASELTLFDGSSAKLGLTFGRQAFSIGAVPQDYLFYGTVDGLTATADFKRFGRLRVLALDLMSGQELSEQGFTRYPKGSEPTFGFDGHNFTTRSGAVYEYGPDANDYGVQFAAFYFFSAIGGSSYPGTGSDISYGGQLGNSHDADWQSMLGGRLAYSRELGGDGRIETDDSAARLDVYGEFAMSDGIDRKAATTDHDVETSGNAFGGGLKLAVPLTSDAHVALSGAFYHFDGADYDSNGMQFDGGFTSFRGGRVGGYVVSRFAGWRPSATLAPDGIDHSPQEKQRAAGTEFFGGALELGYSSVTLTVEGWHYTDTGHSFVDFSNLAALRDPPYGYSKAEIAAQKRLGKTLGVELGARLELEIDELAKLYIAGGAFMPGDFYSISVDRATSGDETALGGTETMTAVSLGTELNF